MKKKNGFVLIETLVVVLLLTVTLMSLYASFSYIVNKTKERNNNDSIETLYKTYYIRDLLDSYQSSHVNDTNYYRDSFLYYLLQMGSSGLDCTAYSYQTGKQVTIDKTNDLMAVCNFENYDPGVDSKDPISEAVKTYNIDKIYYINFYDLSNSDFRTDLLNKLDASSIDYVLGEPQDNGYFMVIKYLKDYTYPSDYDVNTNVELKNEAFHSSIAMSNVASGDSSAEINFCNNNECDESVPSSTLLKNGDSYTLSSVAFNNTTGRVILGWYTDNTKTYDDTTFAACVKNTEEGTSSTDGKCYNLDTEIKVSSVNRRLYAYWCGDGTLKGMIECNQTEVSSHAYSTDGLNYNKTSGISYYYGSVGNNYIILGDTCYRLVISDGDPSSSSSNGFKAIYAGQATETNKCANTNYSSLNTNWRSFPYAVTSSYVSDSSTTVTKKMENTFVNSQAFRYSNGSTGGEFTSSTFSSIFKDNLGSSYSCGDSYDKSGDISGLSSSQAYNTCVLGGHRYLRLNNDSSKTYYYVFPTGTDKYSYVVINSSSKTESDYMSYLGTVSSSAYTSRVYNALYLDSGSSNSYLINRLEGDELSAYYKKGNFCNDMSFAGSGAVTFGTGTYTGTGSILDDSSITNFMNYMVSYRVQNNTPAEVNYIKNDTVCKGYKFTGTMGLLDADEAMYVGIGNSNSDNYLVGSNGSSYWTMSQAGTGTGYVINSSGNLQALKSSSTSGIRPVIILKYSDKLKCGNGAMTTPYVVNVDGTDFQDESETYCS